MVLAAIQSHVRVAVPQLARPKSWMGYFFIHSLEYADKVGYTKCNTLEPATGFDGCLMETQMTTDTIECGLEDCICDLRM